MKLDEIKKEDLKSLMYPLFKSKIAYEGHVRQDGKIDCLYAELTKKSIEGETVFDKNGVLLFEYGVIEEEFYVSAIDEIKSLKGCPERVELVVLYSLPNIKEIDYFPAVITGEAKLSSLPNLTSIKGLRNSKISNLKLKDLDNLKSFEGLPKIMNGTLTISNIPNAKNLLQIFKTKGIAKIDFTVDQFEQMGLQNSAIIEKILNKHYKTGDMIECQEELIEAGFKDYARLK